MAKYFCPKCKTLTFALRYQTGQTWYKIGKQWCETCEEVIDVKKCIEGAKGLDKNNRR